MKWMKRRAARLLPLGIVLLALVGCASPAQVAAWQREASRPILCQGQADCARKWSRALTWIEDDSDRPLTIANDTMIQTTEPRDDSADPAYRVTMLRDGAGGGRIRFEAYCDNILGCVPSVLEDKADFAYYVRGD